MLKKLSVLLLFLFLVLPIAAQETNLTHSCVTDYAAALDYFPDKAEVAYAQGFTVEYFNNYKVVTVVPWVGAEEAQTYVLVQCGTPAPENIEADAVVEVPVKSIVTLSTTILPHLETQGVVERLVAVDTLLFTSTESVLEHADDIAEVGGGGMGDINVELLLELEPDLIMGQQFWGGDTSFAPVREADLNLVLNSDFADTSPLAQAEWGKFVALFFNTEALANDTFAKVETQYNDFAALTADIADEERPTVIAASPYQGSWYMPAGDSTISQLINDAGGNFVFSDLEGTSVVLDFETVFEEGGEADFWININQFWATTDDMLADDPRYEEFSAFANGSLWNNNLRQNANGGNDFFESGFSNPHWVLADLMAIFHPELLPEHEFTYYQLLETPDSQ
jgi:iron complex transport system substrate-binding protein